MQRRYLSVALTVSNGGKPTVSSGDLETKPTLDGPIANLANTSKLLLQSRYSLSLKSKRLAGIWQTGGSKNQIYYEIC